MKQSPRVPLTNMQDKETQYLRPSGHLDVHSMFKTLQGEGPFSGQRSIFVRLSGCNLQCPKCDTDYTSKQVQYAPKELAAKVFEMMEPDPPDNYLVVLTGGEPFRQNIAPFIKELTDRECMVQIETNGTLWVPDIPWETNLVVPVCSPKTPQINPNLATAIDDYGCFKYVIQAGFMADDGLPIMTLGNGTSVYRPHAMFSRHEIYVQPLDEGTNSPKTYDNAQACVASALTHGYTLGLQTHKFLGLE